MCDFQNCSLACYSLFFLPGTASMSNMARAALTLSIRTVSFPCSSSRTKRSPSPLRAANSSCVSPAAFFDKCSNLIHDALPPQHESAFILYPKRYKSMRLQIEYTLSGIKQALSRAFAITPHLFRCLLCAGHGFSASWKSLAGYGCATAICG